MGHERMKDPSTFDTPLETYDGAAGGYRIPVRPLELLVKQPGEWIRGQGCLAANGLVDCCGSRWVPGGSAPGPRRVAPPHPTVQLISHNRPLETPSPVRAL